MNDPVISVIIPCFNRERYLEAALQSVLWQTFTEWECILVDDGSTDRSAAIFQRHVDRDDRFRYLHEENQGPSAARNLAIGIARGEFVQFLDSDDIIPPGRFRRCVDRFRQEPDTDVVYTNYVGYRRREGFVRPLPARIPGNDPLKAFLFEQNETFATVIHSFLFKRPVVVAHPFDTSFRNLAEDIECWIRMAADGVRFSYVDEVLAVYRYSEDSLAVEESALYAMRIQVLERYQGDPRCAGFASEFAAASRRMHQRLVVGYFMERSFGHGWKEMKNVWRESTWGERIKMSLWGTLMTVFSRDQIFAARAWVLAHTFLRWGGWVNYATWDAPPEVRQLLSACDSAPRVLR